MQYANNDQYTREHIAGKARPMNAIKMLIGGTMVDGAVDQDVTNPATGKPFMACGRASRAQLDDAVAAAKAAFPAWSKTPIDQRRACLMRIADIVETNTDELARLLTLEQGKPLAQSKIEVVRTAAAFREVAGLQLDPAMLADTAARRVELQRRPLGVVAAIVPWNFPLVLTAAKVPYALLAGNTVVLKPAPTTPVATLRMCELIKDVVPAGVLNAIADDGDLGEALTTHPDVQKISFTGSTATGRRVMASAAASLKRLTLELGGNDAAIVLDDVDVADAAPKLFNAAFRNSGQVCAAVKRVYAPDAIYDSLCSALAELARGAVVGDGMTEGVEFGPLQNQTQYDRVCNLLEETEKDGTILAGGKMQSPGYFIRPTIVRDILDGARLVDEEQFGPVLPIIRYVDADDAVARANSSEYGLGGSVWSSDMARARRYAEQMDCGTVWINKHAEMAHAFPFAGSKQSGFGVEMSQHGLNEFTQIRVINAAME
jgi:acyl-CoA reductase-like NAD-dependent aldehyde dehydrogenase